MKIPDNCPHCGGKSYLWHNQGKGYRTAKIICHDCGAAGPTMRMITYNTKRNEFNYDEWIKQGTERMKISATKAWDKRQEVKGI